MKRLTDLAKKKKEREFPKSIIISFPIVVVQPLLIVLYPYDFNINALL